MSLVAGLALAETAVESANIVGYQDFGGFGNFNLTAITFEPIEGESFTLKDISVNEKFDNNGDYISVFEGGTKVFEVSYLNEGDGDYGEPAGWYIRSHFLDDWEFPAKDCKDDYVLGKGKGIVFNRNSNGAAIRYKGQVQSKDFTFGGFGNFNITANNTPVDIKLGDILPNEKFDNNGDYISVFEGGTKVFEVSYLNEGDGDYGEPAGWYLRSHFLDDWEFPAKDCKDDYVLPAGKGFVFNRNSNGAAIILPNPMPEESK